MELAGPGSDNNRVSTVCKRLVSTASSTPVGPFEDVSSPLIVKIVRATSARTRIGGSLQGEARNPHSTGQ